MNKTGYASDPFYLLHETEPHPENPGRLTAIQNRLESSEFYNNLTPIQPRKATVDEIANIHDLGYIASVEQNCADHNRNLDADTVISQDSYNAALLSAGAGMTAIDQLVDGKINNAFCAVRPPGHHAEQDRAMGFCLFNNVAIAARYAQKIKALNKIFIFDWDVHHGNGTQHSFYNDPSVYYASAHQHPFYPGSGAEEETGTGEGLGTTLNLPMDAYSDDEDYIAAVENRLISEIQRYNPDLIIISAGFDAHKNDPLAQIQLTTECFGKMTELLMQVAQDVCSGRILSMLEGGYDYNALSDSVQLHMQTLLTFNPKS
ncbi:MAG: histone deacetylase [Nitrospinaceae bacterium]|nr:histone deacetylase [Nitrospina sp.]MBT5376437.1 histone deacetylase [Nitrospinaceae bacterium]MBT6346154.1 histone deacetylase [Nitrospina sp.]